MNKDEKVLCITAGSQEDISSALSRAQFLSRDQVEFDRSYLQVIPYVVFMDISTGLVATYRRSDQSGDPRLRGVRSCGIGGHVDERDCPLWCSSQTRAVGSIMQCIARELREEIGADLTIRLFRVDAVKLGSSYQTIYVGHQSPDLVDQVHVGILILVRVPVAFQPDGEIRDFAWVSPYAIVGDPTEYERWSVVAAEHVIKQ